MTCLIGVNTFMTNTMKGSFQFTFWGDIAHHGEEFVQAECKEYDIYIQDAKSDESWCSASLLFACSL